VSAMFARRAKFFSKRTGVALAVYFCLGLYFILLWGPILWGVNASLQENGTFTLQRYLDFEKDPKLKSNLQNSLLVATVTTLGTVLVATLGGYGLSRFSLPGRTALLTTVFSSRMFPFILIVIPIFLVFSQLSLVGTYLGVILAHITLGVPFTLWVAKAYFDNVPRELEEAAMLDGCGRWTLLRKIILPLAAPGIALIAFYAFTISWGDYLMVSWLSQEHVNTLPFKLQERLQERYPPWESILAITTLLMIPPTLFFALVQRWFVTALGGRATR